MTFPTKVLPGEIDIELDGHREVLAGVLNVPANAAGIVLFVHGSGSSRHSVRNQCVASVLRWHGLGTLIFDLLTEDEVLQDSGTGSHRFQVEWLAARLARVTRWVLGQPLARTLPLGYFGASTGAAAALIAAAKHRQVSAVVSRGGR